MPNNKTKPIKTGTIFNRLTIIRFHHKDKRWRRFYLCKCECGTEKVIQGSLMVSSNTKSCGCLSVETKIATALPGSLGAMRQVILQNYKRGGKKRKWYLTESQFYNLSQLNCYYCGDAPSQTKKGQGVGHDFIYNGLDRINPQKEYTFDNVVACCKKCKVAKNCMTIKEFCKWAKKLNAMAEQWSI